MEKVSDEYLLLNITDNLYLEEVWYRWDDGPKLTSHTNDIHNISIPFRFGRHVLYVFTKDKAGNVNVVTYSVRVIPTVPFILLFTGGMVGLVGVLVSSAAVIVIKRKRGKIDPNIYEHINNAL